MRAIRLDPLPRDLPAVHRRWIYVNALAVTAVINVVLNAVIAWLSAGDRSEIPLWATPLTGGPSTITDTAGTLFLLPLITCVLVTTAVRHDQRRGALPPLPDARRRYPELVHLPAGRVLRGAVFGAALFVAWAGSATLILVAAGFGDVSVTTFVAYKTLLALALGAVVTPLIALCAMTDEP